ncbi:DNA cytosine methyltransferase [Alishewanella sp. d11]|uniref:DNA cytosine methyltransferase n=1 Tax=Alishewanella sp. d11 TaxID=3414030 RepID=UPI003BF85B47
MQVVGVDLFCGAGGLTHGLKKAGIKVAAGVDIDPACKYPYEVNNGAKFLHKSVSEVTGKHLLSYYPVGAVKLLAGCAPCQPFSKYAQGRPRDERWGLLYHFARLVDEMTPELVTMENVPELIKHEVYQEFKSKLLDSGYHVADKVMFGPDYGMAQTRRRLVLVASRLGEIDIIPATHKPAEYQTVRNAIAHLPSLNAGQTHHDDPLHRAGGLTEINLKRIRASKPNGTWRDWPADLIAKCHLKDSGKGYSSVYGRMSWDEPSPTMTTQCYGFGNGRFGHPEQDRAISLREAAILQSFPDEYKFADRPENYNLTTLGRMIGNAVPVRLGEVVGLSIRKHLTAVNHSWPIV